MSAIRAATRVLRSSADSVVGGLAREVDAEVREDLGQNRNQLANRLAGGGGVLTWPQPQRQAHRMPAQRQLHPDPRDDLAVTTVQRALCTIRPVARTTNTVNFDNRRNTANSVRHKAGTVSARARISCSASGHRWLLASSLDGSPYPDSLDHADQTVHGSLGASPFSGNVENGV